MRAAALVAQSIVLARALGLRDYGIYAVVGALAAPIQEMLNPNLGAAIVRYGTNYIEDDERDNLIALVQLAYLIAIVFVLSIVAVSALAVTLCYDMLFDVPQLRLCALVYAAAASLAIVDSNSFAMLRLFNRFRISAIVELFASVASFCVVALACNCYAGDVPSIVLIVSATVAFSSVLANGVSFWVLKDSLPDIWKFDVSCLVRQFRETFRFVVGNSLALTFERTTRRCDVLLLAFMSPGSNVAIYDVARKISSLILLVRDPISMAVFPQVSRMVAKKEFKSIFDLLWQAYRMLALPLVCFMLVICFFGNRLAGIWGPEFVDSSWTVQLLSIRAMLFVVFFWNMSLILSFGKVRFQLVASITSTFVGFCIAVPMTNRYGASGMAFSMLVATLLAQGAYAFVSIRETRIEVLAKELEPVTV